jgi:hypothetical protein
MIIVLTIIYPACYEKQGRATNIVWKQNQQARNKMRDRRQRVGPDERFRGAG